MPAGHHPRRATPRAPAHPGRTHATCTRAPRLHACVYMRARAPVAHSATPAAGSPARSAQPCTSPSISAGVWVDRHRRKATNWSCPVLSSAAQLITLFSRHSAGPCWQATPPCATRQTAALALRRLLPGARLFHSFALLKLPGAGPVQAPAEPLYIAPKPAEGGRLLAEAAHAYVTATRGYNGWCRGTRGRAASPTKCKGSSRVAAHWAGKRAHVHTSRAVCGRGRCDGGSRTTVTLAFPQAT